MTRLTAPPPKALVLFLTLRFRQWRACTLPVVRKGCSGAMLVRARTGARSVLSHTQATISLQVATTIFSRASKRRYTSSARNWQMLVPPPSKRGTASTYCLTASRRSYVTPRMWSHVWCLVTCRRHRCILISHRFRRDRCTSSRLVRQLWSRVAALRTLP